MMTNTDNGDLVQDFEEAFQKCISVLTEDDDTMDRNKETIEKKVEENVAKFTDCARQLETFFLQKRFYVYNHKPEMVLKEDTNELRAELLRKDELIRKHYEKLNKWQSMLDNVQSGGMGQQIPPPPSAGPLPPPPGATAAPHHGIRGPTPNFMNSRMPGGPLAHLERTTSNIGGTGGIGPNR